MGSSRTGPTVSNPNGFASTGAVRTEGLKKGSLRICERRERAVTSLFGRVYATFGLHGSIAVVCFAKVHRIFRPSAIDAFGKVFHFGQFLKQDLLAFRATVNLTGLLNARTPLCRTESKLQTT